VDAAGIGPQRDGRGRWLSSAAAVGPREPALLGRALIKPRLVNSDLINVRFGPLCGLKSDISRGPRSAQTRTSPDHSIVGATSSDDGTSTPSALAIFRIAAAQLFRWARGRVCARYFNGLGSAARDRTLAADSACAAGASTRAAGIAIPSGHAATFGS
jgi:hypothetical protein